jgi:hypothetical protein
LSGLLICFYVFVLSLSSTPLVVFGSAGGVVVVPGEVSIIETSLELMEFSILASSMLSTVHEDITITAVKQLITINSFFIKKCLKLFVNSWGFVVKDNFLSLVLVRILVNRSDRLHFIILIYGIGINDKNKKTAYNYIKIKRV